MEGTSCWHEAQTRYSCRKTHQRQLQNPQRPRHPSVHSLQNQREPEQDSCLTKDTRKMVDTHLTNLPTFRMNLMEWDHTVTTWVQHSVDSHPFPSMSIGHPIPELWLFQNLTLKIKGQGHGWGPSWESQHGSKIQSTHIPFVPCGSGIPFLSYDFFKIWPWKSRVKVMGGVTVQSHNMGLISYRFTSLSFHVNRPSHSWHTAFSKFDLENQGSRSNDHDVAQLQVLTIP